MKSAIRSRKIGIIGGGPAALFMYKQLVDAGYPYLEISIFERNGKLGAGMPYSVEGASQEHITNVSDNEIPELVSSIAEWLPAAPVDLLRTYNITEANFNEYKVLPRLLFGEYLTAQFELLLAQGKAAGIKTTVHYHAAVVDLKDDSCSGEVTIFTEQNKKYNFDTVVICTGHKWPKKKEGKVANWFDSPYPPQKLAQKVNYPVAIKGSSLSAIDAVKTLARSNGHFTENENKSYTYHVNEDSRGFSMQMHSLGGLLPAIRFHLEDSNLSKGSLLTEAEVKESMDANGGYVPLDYIFEYNFKEPIRKEDPAYYETIKGMNMEQFVEYVMQFRKDMDAFTLFKAEYKEAEKSILRQESVYWKEMLAVLSYAMNYPAKHLSAEDMLRLKKTLMPLVSLVIAFVPQSSCREMIALYDAGILSLVPVDKKSQVTAGQDGGAVYSYCDQNGREQVQHYKMFIDSVGQPAFMYKDFLFKGLVDGDTVSPAYLRFKSAAAGAAELQQGNEKVRHDEQDNYYLYVPGININDSFQVLDKYGAANARIYIMAVPYIGGLNPDYSGLDFCEEASERIASSIFLADKVME